MFKSKSKASKLLRQLQLKQLQREPEPPRQDYLSERECHRTYSCIHCRAHLANHDELISKLFQGNHGRAYLFNKVVNVGCKQAVERELLTGLHAVADIFCDCCETTLGWKYEQAFVPSQKYKEGKYIIELVHMLKENNWDLTSYNSKQLLEEQQQQELADEQLAYSSARRPVVARASAHCGSNDRQGLRRQISNDNRGSSRESTRNSTQNDRANQFLTTITTPSASPTTALDDCDASQQDAIRRPISTSSSYTTISLRKLSQTAQQQQQHTACIEPDNLTLNSSGASGSSSSNSSSTSHENLGQLGDIDNDDQQQRQQQQKRVLTASRRQAADNNSDEKNLTATTRETIELTDRRHQEFSAAGGEQGQAAISVQQ